jgi:serine/threonine protein phosphatase PrpC
MEDAHIHKTDVDEHGTCIFGVFDGHGGNFIIKTRSQNIDIF